jgi:hypothetical protein
LKQQQGSELVLLLIPAFILGVKSTNKNVDLTPRGELIALNWVTL